MKKGRFLWSAHRITERRKAGKARSIKEKQLKNSRSTEKQPVQAAPKRTRERELRMSYKEQRDYETIDQKMEQLQKDLEELDRQIEQNASDFVKLTELTQKREAAQQALDEAEERWLYLTDLAERIEAQKKG